MLNKNTTLCYFLYFQLIGFYMYNKFNKINQYIITMAQIMY